VEATVTDNPDDKIDNPLDIRDDGYDDYQEVEQEVPPTEIAPEQDSTNWQSELVSKAREAKLPDSVIQRLESPDAVNELLSIIAAGIQKEPVAETKAVEPAPDPDELNLEIDEENAFDPEAARAIKKMADHYEKKFRALESRVAESSRTDLTSGFVRSLGDQWSKVFGTEEKPNVDNIKKLDDAVQTIRAGYVAKHRRIPESGELMNMALNASFGDMKSEIERNKIEGKIAKRAGQFVSRPGTRTTNPANGRSRAAQSVAEWFKSRGIDPYAAGDSFE
jgi:hypothetical protein